jgi:hypothetical protein
MTVQDTTPAPPPKGRLIAGAAVFALGWIATLGLVPVITASALPSSLAGIVVFVGPKLGVLAAIAIMGRSGFVYLKTQVFGLLQPPADVGPTRYRIGIVMFVTALGLGFLEPYGLIPPRSAERGIRVSLAVDLLLVASIFVLGASFWDKIRALFVRDARVYFPDSVRG